MTDKIEQLRQEAISLIQRFPRRFIGLLLIIALAWFVTHYRSDAYFTLEGVTLGMTTEEVMHALPDAGKFQKIAVQMPKSGDFIKFEILETEKHAPWSWLMVVAIDGKVASVSARASELTSEQVDEHRARVISLFGEPDDVLESKYVRETLTWGDVTFDEKGLMQGIEEINGRAIIYRSNDLRSVNIYVSRDGEGPRFPSF